MTLKFPHQTQETYYSYALLSSFLIALVYASVLIYPYLLADDTYLIRSNSHFKHFDTGMGRPVFWYLINLNALLFEAMGTASLFVFRALAVAAIAATGYLWYKWLVKFDLKPEQAFACVAGICTIPSFQIIVGNGAWLAPAVFVAISCGISLYELVRDKFSGSHPFLSFRLVCISLGTIFAFSTYQTLGFLAAVPGLVPLIFAKPHDNAKLKQEMIFVVCILATVSGLFVFYYLCWLFLLTLIPPVMGGAGYLPEQSVGFIQNIIAGLSFLLDVNDYNWPIAKFMNMWVVSGEITYFSYFVLFFVFLGLASFFRQFHSIYALSAVGILCVSLLFQFNLVFLIDVKHLMSKFTVATGIMVIITLLLIRGLQEAIHFSGFRVKRAVWLSLAAFFAVTGSLSFSQKIVAPSIFENASINLQLDKYDPEKHKAILVTRVMPKTTLSGYTPAEFGFRNITGEHYIRNMIEVFLDERGLNHVVPIRVREHSGIVVADYNVDATTGNIWENENILEMKLLFFPK